MTKFVIPGTSRTDNEDSAILYFGLSAAVILLAIVVYIFVLERSPVTKYYLSLSRQDRQDKLSELMSSNAPKSVASGVAYLRTLRVLCCQLQAQGQRLRDDF